jgi:hypothetical protein
MTEKQVVEAGKYGGQVLYVLRSVIYSLLSHFKIDVPFKIIIQSKFYNNLSYI